MRKKSFSYKFASNKKTIAISVITVLVGVGSLIGSYFIFNRPDDKVNENGKEEFNIDYIKYVSGIKDWIVQVGVDNDFLQGVRWETYVIKDVTVDLSGVTKDKKGKYSLVYKIDIKDSKEQYLEKAVTVEVVSAEKAKELTSKGKDVVLAVADEISSEEKEEKEENGADEAIDGEENKESDEDIAFNDENLLLPNDDNSNNGPNNSPSELPHREEASHSHSWSPITNIVYHDEVGHWEEVVIKESWVEEKTIYEERQILICNDCGADLTYLSGNDIDNHINNHMANGESGTMRTVMEQVKVGTEVIYHPAVTEKKWIIDKASWNETITTGYKCSCGATK